jgi:hypothetical protein
MFGYICDEVPQAITVHQAHRLVQLHRDCGRHCPSRQAALAVLEEEGHYRLASRFG